MLAAHLILAAALAAPPARTPPPADPQLLRGPEVRDDTPPTGGATFGAPDATDTRDRTDHALLLSAIGALQTEEAPLALRLTDAQAESLAQIRAEQQAEMREWSQDNLMTLAALREKRRALENAPPEQRAEAMRALLRESQEARASRPDAAPHARRAWALLTDPQRAFVEQRVRAEEERRFEEFMRRRLGLAPDEPINPADSRDDNAIRARRDAATLSALGLSAEQLRELRTRLLAPPTDEEKLLPAHERMRRRLDALPDGLLTEEQRSRVEALLIERAMRSPR